MAATSPRRFYLLNDEDITILEGLIAREKKRSHSPKSRDYAEEYLDAAPEVFIAKTPPEGIYRYNDGDETGTGSGSAFIPGSAECTIYRLLTWTNPIEFEEQEGRTETVYNLSTKDVPGDTYILIVKDKWGVWVASGLVDQLTEDELDEPGTGTGTAVTGGYCDLAILRQTDCVLVDTPGQGTFLLEYSEGSWSSLDEYDYTVGQGPFEFWYEAGRLHLSLDGLELLDCGNGCFSGGPLTGHGAQVEGATGTGTGTGALPLNFCSGESFTVCVRCSCCLDEGWYCVDLGSGCEAAYLTADEACSAVDDGTLCSGPYATEAEALVDCPAPEGPPITTACCPGVDTPRKLYMHFSVGGGTYACANGTTVGLTYNDGTSKWEYTGAWCAGGTATFAVYCDAGAWKHDLDINTGGFGTCSYTGQIFDTFGCDALSDTVTMDFSYSETCFFGTLNITVDTTP